MDLQDLCPHRPRCPGCDLLEDPYEAQLERKTTLLRQALAAYPQLRQMTVHPCLGATERTGYRTRVKWAVAGSRIGLFGREHKVVDTPHCPVARPAARKIAALLRERPPERGATRLAALDLRVAGSGSTVATLVVRAPTSAEARDHAARLARWLLDPGHLPELVGVAWSWRPPRAPTTLGRAPEPLLGTTTLVDRIGLAATHFPPGTFSQAHAGQTEQLHRLLRAALLELEGYERAHLLDLFAGTGGIGLALADLVAETTLVEAFAGSARAAEQAATELGVNARVLAGNAEQALARPEPAPSSSREGAAEAARTARRPLVVVVDPPRRGLAPELLADLAHCRPELAAYVSCSPATLARDLAVLASHGLRSFGAQPIDMMPGTGQVEALVLLRPGEPFPPAAIVAGEGWLLLDRPGHLPLRAGQRWPCSLRGRTGPADDQPLYLPAPCSGEQEVDDDDVSGLTPLSAPAAAPGPFGGQRIIYTVLVRGIIDRAGSIARPPDRSRYRRLAVAGGQSLIEAETLLGSALHLRRHLALIGHPVLGDARYGDPAANRYLAARHGLIRPFAHASRLLPQDGSSWTSPLAPDLEAVWRSLQQDGQDETEDDHEGV